MKKSIAILLIAVGVLMTGVSVFADANELPEWFEDMIEWRKGQVQESLDAGTITAEQAEVWNQHFDDMVEYHQESGFPVGGGCRGGGMGGFRNGGGPGWRWNQE